MLCNAGHESLSTKRYETMSTVNSLEIQRYNALAQRWWDASGVMWPLHKLNALRVPYICEQIAGHGLADGASLAGLRMLDIGCGAGLLAEAMASRGAQVVAIDPAVNNIAVARDHARQQGLDIDYRVGTLEEVVGDEKFNVVLNMEVVEHVEQLPNFMAGVCARILPGGMQFVATINRTLLSLVVAKWGAEYILKWLPRGTHEWRKFVSPGEVADYLRAGGLTPVHTTGVRVNPLNKQFSLTASTQVNYMMVGRRDL